MSSESLNISALFDYSNINYQTGSDICMDVILSTPEKLNKKRVPLNLCVCLDCSGSMGGNKLKTVKRTVSVLVEHLLEDDGLVILGFSDSVWEAFSSNSMTKFSKETAQKAIKSLHTLGSTNFSQTITMALEKVMTGRKDVVSRVILLTDGLPTTGICDSEGLVKMVSNINPQISLSTFGFGTDYNPELLASLSSAGRGGFFYIQKDEDCNKAFAMELGGLLSLYAQNLKLKLVPSGNMKFLELLSDYKCEQKNGYRLTTSGSIEVTIDDIFFGEKKHVVFKLSVPAATEAVCARQSRVCDLDVAYTLVENKSFEGAVESARIQYVKPDKAQKDPNMDVQKQMATLEAAKIQKEAQEKADQGDMIGARSVLSAGQDWVLNNSVLFENAPQVTAMFSNLSANYVDQSTYRLSGSKMSNSYRSKLSTGRGASADTMDFESMTRDQMITLKSFTSTGTTTPADTTEPPKSA